MNISILPNEILSLIISFYTQKIFEINNLRFINKKFSIVCYSEYILNSNFNYLNSKLYLSSKINYYPVFKNVEKIILTYLLDLDDINWLPKFLLNFTKLKIIKIPVTLLTFLLFKHIPNNIIIEIDDTPSVYQTKILSSKKKIIINQSKPLTLQHFQYLKNCTHLTFKNITINIKFIEKLQSLNELTIVCSNINIPIKWPVNLYKLTILKSQYYIILNGHESVFPNTVTHLIFKTNNIVCKNIFQYIKILDTYDLDNNTLSHFPNINKLVINEYIITTNIINQLNKLNHLNYLKIVMFTIDDDTINNLYNIKNINTLEIDCYETEDNEKLYKCFTKVNNLIINNLNGVINNNNIKYLIHMEKIIIPLFTGIKNSDLLLFKNLKKIHTKELLY